MGRSESAERDVTANLGSGEVSSLETEVFCPDSHFFAALDFHLCQLSVQHNPRGNVRKDRHVSSVAMSVKLGPNIGLLVFFASFALIKFSAKLAENRRL